MKDLTLSTLKSQLFVDESNPNTIEGWINYDSQELFVRKHWSYDGGYPAYSDESISNKIGEFVQNGEPFKKFDINGNPILDEHGVSQIYDVNLIFVRL